MDKVKRDHSGKFTISPHALALPNGHFESAFTITEHVLGDIGEVIDRNTGRAWATQQAALDDASDAARTWLDVYRPTA